jgi:hypothetical protein
MFSFIRNTSFATALLLALGPGTVHAQAAPADKALHEIAGFRSARFGMNEDQVRAAVARDFKDQATLLQTARHPDPRYSVLVLPLPALEPGPGPAGVTYIFAAQEHKLVQVNVLWSMDKPGARTRRRWACRSERTASCCSAGSTRTRRWWK